MRNISLPILFGFLLIIYSCDKNVPTVINGNLTNFNDTTITIEIGKVPITGLNPVNYQNVFKISKEGTFSIPIETPLPVQVVLYSENFTFFARVFLIHAGEINLTADCSNLKETLEYQGVSDSLNTFYVDFIKYREDAYSKIEGNINSLSAYTKSLDSLQAVSLKMLEDFDKVAQLTKDELLWLSSGMKYTKYFRLCMRAYRLKSDPSDSAYQFFKTLNLNDHDASLISESYNEIIYRYNLYEVNLSGIAYSDSDDKSEYFKAFYDIIHKKLTGKVRDASLTAFISDMLKNNNDLAKEYYEYYLADCRSPKMVEKTSTQYHKYLTIVQKPLSDSVIFIPTNLQRPMEVLKQFEEKVILMDFWASWCSPCIRGLPHTKKLAENYENQAIEVLFVGNKDQESSLIHAIKVHNLSGNHIILNEDESDTWREEFNITGIPTYVLMDKEGKVVDTEMPHQITEETYSLIDSLLATL